MGKVELEVLGIDQGSQYLGRVVLEVLGIDQGSNGDLSV